MAATDEQEISADEIALYDRQIRLWGMKAQEKIRTANILVVKLSGLGTEVVKNFVLSGIGALTVVDHGKVRDEDLSAGFFYTEGDVGKNRAAAAAPGIVGMNPRVKLTVDESDIRTKPASFYDAFDIVIATDLKFATSSRINDACRASKNGKGTPFYASSAKFGLHGYIFADLISHPFVIQRQKSNVKIAAGDKETPTRSVIAVETQRESNDKTIEVITKLEKYVSMRDMAAAPLPLDVERSLRKKRQVPPVLSCLRALWESECPSLSPSPTPPSDSNSNSNSEPPSRVQRIVALAQKHHAELGLGRPDNADDADAASALPESTILDFLDTVDAQISPVAAFLGGRLAQDVINVLSQREQPIQNLLIFDGQRTMAPILAMVPREKIK